MTQVSEIIVHWTPETSGRAASIQIQSRIAGQSSWSQQATSFNPAAGEFRFTANAPSADVEVRCRMRSVDGIYGDWFTANITTAPAVVEYDAITGAPTNLSDINAGEGTKLGGIQPGATVGGTIGVNIKDGNGNVWSPPVVDFTQLEADIAAAVADLNTTRNGLAAEVTRAQNAEGALNTAVVAAQQTANSAVTSINDKYTLLTNADTALANRSTALEAQMAGTQGSVLLTRIVNEETVRANAVSAVANRATTLEAQLAGTQGSAIQTRISNEETARANADNALGGRTSTLESQFTGVTGSALLTRIATEETTRANADSALATRSSTLEAQMAGTQASNLNSRISTVEAVTTNGTFAAASSLSTLSSTVNGLSSTVSTQAGTISTLQGRAAAYWSVSSVAGSGRAQLSVYADANGGGGVDIVGDTTFRGSLNVGPDSGQRCKITNNGMTVYDVNNVMRVRVGIW